MFPFTPNNKREERKEFKENQIIPFCSVILDLEVAANRACR